MEQIESKQRETTGSKNGKVKENDTEEFIKIGDLPLEDSKPGQRYPTPSPGFADRVFYETLLRQRPDSQMAQEWCVAYGVLTKEEAHVLWQEICERKARGGNSRKSVKSPSRPVSSSNGTKKQKTRGRILDDDEADTGFDDSAVFETQGAAGL